MFALDETLFMHNSENEKKSGFLGEIETKFRRFSLELSKSKSNAAISNLFTITFLKEPISHMTIGTSIML